MITITPDNQIERDGEIIGSIIGGIAWLKSKQAPRIVGQIRQAAGIDGLKFEIADTPEEVANLPTGKDGLQVEAQSSPDWQTTTIPDGATILHPPISSAAGVDDGSVMEPVPVSDDAGAGISFEDAIGFVALNPIMESEQDRADDQSFAIGSDWGTPGTPYFARCFINNHGSDAYAQYCRANGI